MTSLAYLEAAPGLRPRRWWPARLDVIDEPTEIVPAKRGGIFQSPPLLSAFRPCEPPQADKTPATFSFSPYFCPVSDVRAERAGAGRDLRTQYEPVAANSRELSDVARTVGLRIWTGRAAAERASRQSSADANFLTRNRTRRRWERLRWRCRRANT